MSSDVTRFMINPAGGVKNISTDQVEQMMAKGWLILPEKEINAMGKPKQTYYPQLDNASPKREKKISGITEYMKREELKVELF